MTTTLFHDDEVAAQRLAGFPTPNGAIRDFMLDQQRAFFADLDHLFASVCDDEGCPVATTLEGPAGFVHALDPRNLRIPVAPQSGDPASAGWNARQSVDPLGLNLSTRRRNRANGVIVEVAESESSVVVARSFGNCPKYIQSRVAQRMAREPGGAERLAGLDNTARGLIRRADTFFLANRSRSGVGPAEGVDISHRTRPSEFVSELGDRLVVPDYPGNRYLNSLGNFLGDPRAGQLFLDFESSDQLQLQGRAEVDWSADLLLRWTFHVELEWRRRAASPFAWRFLDWAPSTIRIANGSP